MGQIVAGMKQEAQKKQAAFSCRCDSSVILNTRALAESPCFTGPNRERGVGPGVGGTNGICGDRLQLCPAALCSF